MKYSYYVRVGKLWSAGDGSLTDDFEQAYPFTEDDKELAYFVNLGFFDDVEHHAQRHAEQWPGAVVVRVDENGRVEEEAIN